MDYISWSVVRIFILQTTLRLSTPSLLYKISLKDLISDNNYCTTFTISNIDKMANFIPRLVEIYSKKISCFCRGDILTDCPHNVGLKEGRISTIPKTCLGLTDKEVESMAVDGLYWSYTEECKSGLFVCVGCKFEEPMTTNAYEVKKRHYLFTLSPNNYDTCSLLGARQLGYETEVIFKKEDDLPFKKPIDPTRFVCDPRDYRLFESWIVDEDINGNGRYVEGNQRNIGTYLGRYNSFPRHSIDYASDVHKLVQSGFMWIPDFENEFPGGLLYCIECDTEIGGYRRGMNPDEIHRKISPDCKWLYHRDFGCDMDKEFFIDQSTRRRVSPWQCFEAHPQAPTPSLSQDRRMPAFDFDINVYMKKQWC